ncbi:hypothetical protein DMC30DRAFT_413410 [Rhodotorula diobovata]|uniref:Uncharacterized protein n=1 Tax=Rhodotorula diobovata TaxID=5288 RepID=A0A5C5G513_9BASI|nr:hypothetical protein DMC30DRAFT_413410 [Rhodotorula diobovata]
MALTMERFAALVTKLDRSEQWRNVVPGADTPWSKVARLGHYNGSSLPPSLKITRADILVDMQFNNASVPALTVPTMGALAEVETDFDGAQDFSTERSDGAYRGTAKRTEWALVGRACGPVGKLYVFFRAAVQKSSDADPLPFYHPPPSYASTPRIVASRAHGLHSTAAPAALVSRIWALLEREDAGIKYRGKGLKDQTISMRVGFTGDAHSSGPPRRALEVLVRLKGIWRPVVMRNKLGHAFMLPGGDLIPGGRDVLDCPVTEPGPYPLATPTTSTDKWTVLSRELDSAHRLVTTTWSLEWHRDKGSEVEVVSVTFVFDDAHEPQPRGRRERVRAALSVLRSRGR